MALCYLVKFQQAFGSQRYVPAGAVEAFAVDAKPADCAMLGLRGPLFKAGK